VQVKNFVDERGLGIQQDRDQRGLMTFDLEILQMVKRSSGRLPERGEGGGFDGRYDRFQPEDRLGVAPEAFQDDPADYARKGHRQAGAAKPTRFACFPLARLKAPRAYFYDLR
jgi:hypothetical protein